MALIDVWYAVRHYVIPTFFIITLPYYGSFMALYSLENGLSRFHYGLLLGNQFSWLLIVILISWAILFLKIPSKTYEGPATSFGYIPRYSANGFQYYCFTITIFIFINICLPELSLAIYDNMPQLLGSLATFAFLLCIYLWWMGKYHPVCYEQQDSLPLIFEFYRGMEIHPRIFDIDVKQLTNCRIGLMLWQLLILAFSFTSYQRIGFNSGMVVNVLLQSIYLAKFYWWETGYFTTLDITLDRAGYYICWGCLAFVPSFFTYSTYYFVSHPPIMNNTVNIGFFLLGITSIYLNYEVDHQKERFRQSGGKCKIWGKKPEFIEAKYTTANGTEKKTQLLLSGYWKVARHMNYVFELLAGLSWNLPGLNLGITPFFYNIFLTILLIHRIYRDEEKCKNKYGRYWRNYCKVVPYRMIPFIY